MAWTGLNLTVEGRNALNKAQTSGELNFKSIVVGDGDTPANFSTMQGLVHQLYEVEDLMVEVKDDSCTLTADFPVVDYDYYFREIGVMVNTDEGAKLYVYDNCGVDAQYIVTTSGVESTRKRIRLLLKISDVAEITVEKPEVLYVSYTDMQKSQAEMEERINEALEEKADNSAMTAATADTAGKAGLVPAPEAGVQTEYLRGDGTWESVDDHIAVFDSGDAVEPTGWANIDTVESGEKHKSLWRKFSLAVKNLRYLYKKLGATDISGIGDGSVTGALSALNTDNAYRDISDQINLHNSNIEIGAAYAENGVAVLRFGVPAGITDANFTINTEYAPRTIITGGLAIVNSTIDYDKLKNATVAQDGNIWIALSQSFAYNESIVFVYPLKKY